MNIHPAIWGKSAWKFLTSVVLAYPDHPTKDQMDQYMNLFMSLKTVLPCEKCKMNYEKNITQIPLTYNDLQNKDSLMTWYIQIRNLVNKEQGKAQLTKYDIIDELYNERNDWKIYISIILILLILIIMYKTSHRVLGGLTPGSSLIPNCFS